MPKSNVCAMEIVSCSKVEEKEKISSVWVNFFFFVNIVQQTIDVFLMLWEKFTWTNNGKLLPLQSLFN